MPSLDRPSFLVGTGSTYTREGADFLNAKKGHLMNEEGDDISSIYNAVPSIGDMSILAAFTRIKNENVE